jgi:poly(3-hydroxybutyrate) depolymerase
VTGSGPPPAAGRRDVARSETGPTCVYALAADPRFSYCCFVPRVDPHAGAPALVVAVHGSARFFQAYRDAFASYCRWNNCVVLCPLFPAGVRGDRNRDGYKYLREGEIRYDELLLKMVDAVAHEQALDASTFGLFGYSGGAHFAHRFFLLHPGRLWALSIGAPGSVTLLDPSRDWWIGTRNVRELFGIAPDLAAMRRVPVQMLVGSADLDTWEITMDERHPYWMPGANDTGTTRPERLEALRASYAQAGISVQYDVVPNTGHDGPRCVPAAADFLAAVLARHRSAV